MQMCNITQRQCYVTQLATQLNTRRVRHNARVAECSSASASWDSCHVSLAPPPPHTHARACAHTCPWEGLISLQPVTEPHPSMYCQDLRSPLTPILHPKHQSCLAYPKPAPQTPRLHPNSHLLVTSSSSFCAAVAAASDFSARINAASRSDSLPASRDSSAHTDAPTQKPPGM